MDDLQGCIGSRISFAKWSTTPTSNGHCCGKRFIPRLGVGLGWELIGYRNVDVMVALLKNCMENRLLHSNTDHGSRVPTERN